jgi:2-polyprenyl-6-hydroxyphenyl methylase/3-demethylubiquinone-9 3-methyltransferase
MERFEFGKNWRNFLNNLSREQIDEAKKKLSQWLGDIEGKTFLDIGCGSGIHSLAARELGAKVFSFDYDNESVECTKYLKEKFFKDDNDWHIEQGSVLDEEYMKKLGKFDIVYSWGVLHHTGDMWRSLDIVNNNVKERGDLYIAIYNTQVYWTKWWTFVKKSYNKSVVMKYFWIGFYSVFMSVKGFVKDVMLLKNPFARYKEYKKNRGMSIYYDLIDWLGGYPFETAKPEEIFEFYHSKGYNLEKLYTANGGYGCNEFLFRKIECAE